MIALTMVYRREIERRQVQFSEFDTYPIDRMLCYILSYVYLDKYNKIEHLPQLVPTSPHSSKGWVDIATPVTPFYIHHGGCTFNICKNKCMWLVGCSMTQDLKKIYMGGSSSFIQMVLADRGSWILGQGSVVLQAGKHLLAS